MKLKIVRGIMLGIWFLHVTRVSQCMWKIRRKARCTQVDVSHSLCDTKQCAQRHSQCAHSLISRPRVRPRTRDYHSTYLDCVAGSLYHDPLQVQIVPFISWETFFFLIFILHLIFHSNQFWLNIFKLHFNLVNLVFKSNFGFGNWISLVEKVFFLFLFLIKILSNIFSINFLSVLFLFKFLVLEIEFLQMKKFKFYHLYFEIRMNYQYQEKLNAWKKTNLIALLSRKHHYLLWLVTIKTPSLLWVYHIFIPRN